MTESFKENILRWLTGKYEVETGENSPQMGEFKVLTNNLKQYIWDNYFTTQKPNIIDIVRGKNANNEPLYNYIIYGYYYDNTVNKTKGFVIVLDELFNPIQGISTYSSGVQIGEIMRLDVDETGKWYIIEKTYENSTIRFMLLNNILLKSDAQTEYQIQIRKSYNYPSTQPEFPDIIYKMIKQYGGSKYVFIGTLSGVSRNVTLSINVGAENDWGVIVFPINVLINDGWAEWNSEGVLDLVIIGNKTGTQNRFYVYEYKDGETVKGYELGTGNFYKEKITILNNKNAYMLATSWDGTVDDSIYNSFVYRIDLDTNRFYLLNSNYYKKGSLGNISLVDITNDGINVYYALTTPDDIDSGTFDYYIGLVYNNKVFEYYAGSHNGDTDLLSQNVTSQFNLYNYYLQIGNNIVYANQIFNNNNYNGLSYNGLDGLVPNSVVMYDGVNKAQNSPVFARNLYNKVIRDNMTISTVQIPNTALNDETVSLEELLSKTNNILNSERRMFQKNIYETVNINFNNTLTIKNSNDPNNEIINNVGSARLNNSISLTADYDNAKITKYKINYQDNTNRIVAIDNDTQVEFIEPNMAIIDIAVYNPSSNPIVNIQFISDDEQTVYQEISTTSFVGNKYYSLTQMVEIE